MVAPGLRRRPHPHGRPGLLGSARHLLVLARRHQRGHGQLRLHAGAVRRDGQATSSCATSSAPRTSPRDAMDAGIEWTWDDLPRVPRRARRAAQGHQLRGLHRPLRAAHLRDGRARLRRGRRPRTTSRAMERELRDALDAGAIGFTTSRSPSHETPDGRPVASRLADVGRGAAAGRRRWASWTPASSSSPARRGRDADDPGAARLPRAPARPRRRDRAADHLRPVQPPRRARASGALPRPARARPRAAGGRMFAQVHSRALTVLLSFKTQLPFDRLPRVARDARAAARPSRSSGCATPSCAQRLVEAARERDDGRARSAPRRGRPHYDWIFVHGPARRAAPDGGRDRARARRAIPVEADDRPGAGDGLRALLPAADRQREPGRRARADASTRARW